MLVMSLWLLEENFNLCMYIKIYMKTAFYEINLTGCCQVEHIFGGG